MRSKANPRSLVFTIGFSAGVVALPWQRDQNQREANQGPLPAGVQQVQGKTFQIKSAPRDFQGVILGEDVVD